MRSIKFFLRLTLIATGVLMLTTVAINLLTINGTETTPNPQLPTVVYSQNPTVVATMQRLGLDYSKMNLIAGASTRYPNARASFVAPNSMYISDKVNPSDINRVVSHEYIHYIEFTVSPQEASSFYPYMNELMNTNTWFYDRMFNYRTGTVCGGTCDVPAEAEAVACTEMTDARLTPDFVAFCNKYLPKRYELL